MMVWIKTKPRKDKKFNVTYGFDNGRRIRKLKTVDQLNSEFVYPFNYENMIKGYYQGNAEIYIEC